MSSELEMAAKMNGIGRYIFPGICSLDRDGITRRESAEPFIIRHGADWYRELGSEPMTGTRIFSFSGDVDRTGFMELPFGTPVAEVLEACGGIAEGGTLKAILAGGPLGSVVSADHLDGLTLNGGDFQALGAALGAGGIVFASDRHCVVHLNEMFSQFVEEESCGRCTTCHGGNQRMTEVWRRIIDGGGRRDDEHNLELIATTLQQSNCAHGQLSRIGRPAWSRSSTGPLGKPRMWIATSSSRARHPPGSRSSCSPRRVSRSAQATSNSRIERSSGPLATLGSIGPHWREAGPHTWRLPRPGQRTRTSEPAPTSRWFSPSVIHGSPLLSVRSAAPFRTATARPWCTSTRASRLACLACGSSCAKGASASSGKRSEWSMEGWRGVSPAGYRREAGGA